MSQPQKQPDRISFSFGMKLSLPTKYESADFHLSLTSDVAADETNAQALARVMWEVQSNAAEIYQKIRNSETGLINEQTQIQQPESKSGNSGNVKVTPRDDGTTRDSKSDSGTISTKPRDLKALRQQIKFAFGVLESQRKVTKDDFKKTYLNNKKTDDLNELEVTKTIVALREKFPELGL